MLNKSKPQAIAIAVRRDTRASHRLALAAGALLVAGAAWFIAQPAHAQSATVTAQASAQTGDTAPDTLIRNVSADVLASLKADPSIKSGDVQKINALIDAKVLPYVDFERMTAAAVGRHWREATPEQKKRLQEEFRRALVRTYAGALSQIGDQTIQMKPFRATPDAKEVIVRSEVRGQGDPAQLDYRMEKLPSGWKIYDVNVLGFWLVDTYRSNWAQEIGTNGIDGLIAKLAEQNKVASAAKN